MKIGNFYEVLSTISNWAPHKLTEINGDEYKFENLNNQKISVVTKGFREIPISPTHLKRLGFEDDALEGVYVLPMFEILAKELISLSHIYFGHIIFHKDDLVDFQKTYNAVRVEILAKYDAEGEITSDFFYEIKRKMKNVSNINELFERLDSYNIIVEDKENIITG